MSWVEFAKEEMSRAGLYSPDSDYGGLIPEAVLALVEAHSKQGHSGGSHSITVAIFNEVINYRPLTPISSDPSEWMEVGTDSRGTCYQSLRKPTCFSYNGGATWYDLDKPYKFRRLRRLLRLPEFAP